MLLPIVIRELRVSARNKATHRLRILFAVGAVTIGGGLGLLSMTGGVFPPRNLAFGYSTRSNGLPLFSPAPPASF